MTECVSKSFLFINVANNNEKELNKEMYYLSSEIVFRNIKIIITFDKTSTINKLQKKS